MASFSFAGNLVGAVNETVSLGDWGVLIHLDKDRDLGEGNPWYSASDLIEIHIAEEDIGENGEFQPSGVDGKVTVTSITVNGTEILTEPTYVSYGNGTDTNDSDAFFYVEGVDLVFLAPQSGESFDTSAYNLLRVNDRVTDLDLNGDGDTSDAGEAGNGRFNIEATQLGEATDGSSAADTLGGGAYSDTLNGGGGSDSVSGGESNDFLYGDAAVGSGTGVDATPLVTSVDNLESLSYTGYSTAEAGDYAIYRDIAQLADGTTVWGRLVLLEKSDPSMTVDLAGGAGYEILLNGNGPGHTASFRLEFFDPATNNPVALNGVASFNDIDANSADDVEAVTLNAGHFVSYATSQNTMLAVAETDGAVRAAGTGGTMPEDENGWFTAMFEDRTNIEFSLESRSTDSGFSFSGNLLSDPLVTEIVQGDDTLDGGEGNDVLYGQGGSDSLDGGEGADTVVGGEGNDVADGGAGNDQIQGDEGADTLRGGAGDDFIEGGTGNDVLYTGTGNDTLDGGDGDDVLNNSSGDDSLVGGAGNDRLVASSGNDMLAGGADNDTLIGGTDNDSLLGGSGNDSLMGDFEASGSVSANNLFAYEYYELDSAGPLASLADAGFTSGTENDNPPDGEGTVDTVDVAAIDAFHGGNGDTFAVKLTTTLTVTGAGTYSLDLTSDDGSMLYVNGSLLIDNDMTHVPTTVSGSLALGAGEHLIEVIYFDHNGGEALSIDISGPDTGGTPISLESAALSNSFDDTLDGGTGDDVITGGLGDDLFRYSVGDGHDTITDFNTGTLTDGNSANNDFIDLSTYYDHLSELWADFDDDGVLNQSNATDLLGNAVDYTNNTQYGVNDSLTFTGGTAGASFFNAENTGVICFVEGTLIETARGSVPVESLTVGDKVQTVDDGWQPVLWIGQRRLSGKMLRDRPEQAPVLIPRNRLGNSVDVRVSPLHGLLLGPAQGQPEEAFARAKHLVGHIGGVRQMRGLRSVRYVHFLLPQHGIVFAGGLRSESFYPGFEALRAVRPKALRRLLSVLPEAAQKPPAEHYGPTARPFLRRRDVASLSRIGRGPFAAPGRQSQRASR